MMQLLDRAVIAVQRRARRRERAAELAAVGLPVERGMSLPARRKIATVAAGAVLLGGLGYTGYNYADHRLDVAQAQGELEQAEAEVVFAENQAESLSEYALENPGDEEARIKAEVAREDHETAEMRADVAQDILQSAKEVGLR